MKGNLTSYRGNRGNLTSYTIQLRNNTTGAKIPFSKHTQNTQQGMRYPMKGFLRQYNIVV